MIKHRATRIRACELAAQMLQGQGNAAEPIGSRLMALCVFFENYIDQGADETEKSMHMLSRRKVKKFKIVAGGKL